MWILTMILAVATLLALVCLSHVSNKAAMR
jgi:hypothetical protein